MTLERGPNVAQGTRSKEQIQAEIAAARERLASNAGEFEAAKAQFVHVDGSPKTNRIAALAVAAVGTIAFLVVVRGLAGRR